jgi:hypothetical protein
MLLNFSVSRIWSLLLFSYSSFAISQTEANSLAIKKTHLAKGEEKNRKHDLPISVQIFYMFVCLFFLSYYACDSTSILASHDAARFLCFGLVKAVSAAFN